MSLDMKSSGVSTDTFVNIYSCPFSYVRRHSSDTGFQNRRDRLASSYLDERCRLRARVHLNRLRTRRQIPGKMGAKEIRTGRQRAEFEAAVLARNRDCGCRA